MHHDPRDCPVSTRSAAAIAHAEQALWRMATYFGDPFADLDAAIQEDPGWVLPLVMKANCLLSATEQPMLEQAHALLDLAGAATGANARERAHVAASRTCALGHWREACDQWERILVEHPRDFLALWSAHLFDFFRGDAGNLHRRVARVLPAWSADTPMYAHVRALEAFGLEESNHYDSALESAQAALALQPREPWAIHAAAHVHEMRGDHQHGARWLESRIADWSGDNAFAFHNWWHLALFRLEQLDTAGALELFDAQIVAGDAMALQHIDVCALLWRLRILGVDVGDRWQHAAQRWTDRAPVAGHYAFNDLHAAMAFVGADRDAQARSLLAAVEARATDVDGGHLSRIAGEIGVPLLRGVIAHGEGDHAGAVEQLLPLRGRHHAMGGSHAQRDVIELTLLDAAIGAGHRALARHLLNERLFAKPGTPLTAHWERRLG
ncbi:tetratricopeptide repeat protein [Luteimonas viscosa]|uniref:Tetratricopeptide repeat protein 38 n=1 Tax=Luteimonas viscosa TaxID=1132694 RepID=A0A5D4XQ59_9GAMM|nr:tetratricopeptide repeat protein [Luteimonas viscosa]TYT26776.1 tetratricopeptide repeat protein [Luteimonas viscosa]